MKVSKYVWRAYWGDASKRLGCRQGSIFGLTWEDAIMLFGEPQIQGCEDERTKGEILFRTPRGLVGIYWYWWNAPNELSIGCEDERAAKWIHWYMRKVFMGAVITEYKIRDSRLDKPSHHLSYEEMERGWNNMYWRDPV